MIVSEVLVSTRDILNDPTGKRWDDTVLIRLLNDCISNFTLLTNYAKSRVFIGIETGISTYDLSSYAISIERVSYLNTILEAKSQEEMDFINPLWEDDIGEIPKYVIFDNLRQGIFKLYPKIITATANCITQNQAYGGLIDISITDDLLLLPSLTTIAFGTNKYLSVYYIEKPATLTKVTDIISIPEIYKAAIVSYISGQALRLDQDTINRAFGAEQLKIYDSFVAKALSKEAKSNNTFHNRQIAYKGFQ